MNNTTDLIVAKDTVSSILLMAERDFSDQESMAKTKSIAERKSSISLQLRIAAFLFALSLLTKYGIDWISVDTPDTPTSTFFRGLALFGAVYLPVFFSLIFSISAVKSMLTSPRIDNRELDRLQTIDRKSVAEIIERLNSGAIDHKYKEMIEASLKRTLHKQNGSLYVYQSGFYTSATTVAMEATEEEQTESAISSFIAPQAS